MAAASACRDERIVGCLGARTTSGRPGPTGPVRPVLGALLRPRARSSARDDDRPGDENERILEYLEPRLHAVRPGPAGEARRRCPAQNIDTGLGLNRMAAIQQGVPSVYETDQFLPLVELGEELSGRKYGGVDEVTRALRILADHSRAMTFLIADGVVPSNEDRGYILRRVMRRAIQQGRVLGLEPGYLPRFADLVRRSMGGEYPELVEQRDAIQRGWRARRSRSAARWRRARRCSRS